MTTNLYGDRDAVSAWLRACEYLEEKVERDFYLCNKNFLKIHLKLCFKPMWIYTWYEKAMDVKLLSPVVKEMIKILKGKASNYYPASQDFFKEVEDKFVKPKMLISTSDHWEKYIQLLGDGIHKDP